jgi:hypothetical protein
MHEQVPFLVDARDYVPALTLENASRVPVGLLAVSAPISAPRDYYRARKKARAVETERAFSNF